MTGLPLAERVLDGAAKAAALLLAMGKPAAGRLLRHFDSAELKEITRAASELGPIAPHDLEGLIEEFAQEFSAGVSLTGTAQEVEKLLTGILPAEQISDIMSVVIGQAGASPWEKVAEAPEGLLVAFITREHPQVAAFILTRLSTETSAKVLGKLPDAHRNGLMRRMATMGAVSPIALRLVEGGLNEALSGPLAKSAAQDSNARLADILNRMEHEQIDAILGSLAETRPDTAKALQSLMFRFEDIIKLTPKSRMALFDGIPAERVVLALKGVEATFREMVLSAIASRARRMVEHELDNGDDPNPRAVQDARRFIAERVLEMSGRGDIEFNASENAVG